MLKLHTTELIARTINQMYDHQSPPSYICILHIEDSVSSISPQNVFIPTQGTSYKDVKPLHSLSTLPPLSLGHIPLNTLCLLRTCRECIYISRCEQLNYVVYNHAW